jgi:hypothetical protein
VDTAGEPAATPHGPIDTRRPAWHRPDVPVTGEAHDAVRMDDAVGFVFGQPVTPAFSARVW